MRERDTGWGLCGDCCEKDAVRGCVKENKHIGKQYEREGMYGLGLCCHCVRKTERGGSERLDGHWCDKRKRGRLFG